MTYERMQLAPRRLWKAGTPGNHFVNGDVVAPALGDEVMFRSDVNAPVGVYSDPVPSESLLTVNLPAITPAAYGRQIKINVARSVPDDRYMFYGSYVNGVVGRVTIQPAASDLLQDTNDFYQTYGAPYTSMTSGYWNRNGEPGGGNASGADAAYINKSTGPQTRPYTIVLTATPPSSDDVYVTGGRWMMETVTMNAPVNPAALGNGFYRSILRLTQADLTAAAATQEFTLSSFIPQGGDMFVGMYVRCTGIAGVGTNISARWGPSTPDLGLWGRCSSTFPTFGGQSLHQNMECTVAPETPGEGNISGPPKIELNTNGGGNLNTATLAGFLQFELFYMRLRYALERSPV